MPPKLRSTSHARSANSRPSTPLDAQPAASTVSNFSESTRDRKRRRTGRNSRVATDPPQETPSLEQLHPEKSHNGSASVANGPKMNGKTPGWVEPPVRTPAPSYADTPWSAVSSDANPILSTMRPLGALPSAADLRKVGLVPSKPVPQSVPVKKDTQKAVLSVLNGDKNDEKKTAMIPAEEPDLDAVIEEILESTSEISPDDLAALAAIPLPDSSEFDVEMLKGAVEQAIRLAIKLENHAVKRGLERMWGNCSKDTFNLSVLDRVLRDPSTKNESAVSDSIFHTVMRAAWRDVRAEEDPTITPSVAPPMTRTRSASSVSSLSSAKSLDAETFAPGMASGAGPSRSRAKGKQAKAAQKSKEKEAPHSVFPSSNDALGQRKRALEEDPGFSDQAISNKRSRLQKSLPKVLAKESRMRSSLGSNRSNIPSPAAPSSNRDDAVLNGMERQDSTASSDAEDNRRLTPLFDDDSSLENNDFCRNCRRNGQLLCCDGCVNSFHFSCLDPPLDPANPPDGEWYCPKCTTSRPMQSLMGTLDKVNEKEFALPDRVRDSFTGYKTGDEGKYEEVAPFPRLGARGRGKLTGRYDDPALLRTVDGKGNLIFCHGCGRTSNGRRPIIQCDYCPCTFHLDCVDPPLANPPNQKSGSDKRHQNWMCPNHVYHDLFYIVKDEDGYDAVRRIRRPRNPRMIDIEVLPEESEDEKLDEQEEEGIMYRVSEKGVKLNFIERVKRENEEMAMKKAAASQYFEYAKNNLDQLTAKANAFYASQKSDFPPEDTTISVLNSRTVAEREAAANLLTFAQSNETGLNAESGKISLLIDQLKASAPNNLPKAETEIASLRALQDLIEQRIRTLNAQSTEGSEPSRSTSS